MLSVVDFCFGMPLHVEGWVLESWLGQTYVIITDSDSSSAKYECHGPRRCPNKRVSHVTVGVVR